MADHLTKAQIQEFADRIEAIFSKPSPHLHDTPGMIEYLTLKKTHDAVLQALADIYGQPVERKIPAEEREDTHRVPVDQYIMENK